MASRFRIVITETISSEVDVEKSFLKVETPTEIIATSIPDYQNKTEQKVQTKKEYETRTIKEIKTENVERLDQIVDTLDIKAVLKAINGF